MLLDQWKHNADLCAPNATLKLSVRIVERQDSRVFLFSLRIYHVNDPQMPGMALWRQLVPATLYRHLAQDILRVEDCIESFISQKVRHLLIPQCQVSDCGQGRIALDASQAVVWHDVRRVEQHVQPVYTTAP